MNLSCKSSVADRSVLENEDAQHAGAELGLFPKSVITVGDM